MLNWSCCCQVSLACLQAPWGVRCVRAVAPRKLRTWKWSSVCFSVCDSGELLKVLNRFYKRKEMQKLAADHGLDGEKSVHIISLFFSFYSLNLLLYGNLSRLSIYRQGLGFSPLFQVSLSKTLNPKLLWMVWPGPCTVATVIWVCMCVSGWFSKDEVSSHYFF